VNWLYIKVLLDHRAIEVCPSLMSLTPSAERVAQLAVE